MATGKASADEGMAVVGWDLGGVHVKAALVTGGRLAAAAQAPYQLRQGLGVLDGALDRLPDWARLPARHAVTMTGELCALFDDRAGGVAQLTDWAVRHCRGPVSIYGGRAGFLAPEAAVAHAGDIASANWHATAAFVGLRLAEALLVDIGSTTADLIPVAGGRVAAAGYTDGERMATGELVYTGAVRTPAMALAERVPFAGREVTLMAEPFATIADVHRLLGTLPAQADQHVSADGRGKGLAETRSRLAHMVGLDGADAPDQAWLDLAAYLAEMQLRRLHDAAAKVISRGVLPPDAPVVGCGVGRFIAEALAARLGRPYHDLSALVPATVDELDYWMAACAPAVAVACLAAGI